MALNQIIIRIILVFLCINGYTAQGSLSLDEAIRKGLDCHPQLKVARSDVAIAQAKLIDAGKLDNPFFEFGLTSQVTDGPDREGSIMIGYSQMFPVTDKLLRQRDVGIADVKLACAEVREVERKFIATIQELYIAAIAAKAAISVLEKQEIVSDEYIELTKQQLQQARGSELDVGAAETEKALATQSRLLAECNYKKAIADLRSKLGIDWDEPITLNRSLDSVIVQLKGAVQYTVPDDLNRADVVAAEVRRERALTDEQLARSESLEDWGVSANYEAARTVDEPVGVERDRFLGLGVRIPLPVRKKGAGRIAEARAATEKAEYELELVRIESVGEVGSKIAALCTVDETLESLQEHIIPQLQAREAKTRDAYQQGLVEFNQVILLMQQQSRSKASLIRAKGDQAMALARLQGALGTHPLLKCYDPAEVKPYKPGTEPENAPFAIPAIRALPVFNQERSGAPKPFKKLFQKFKKG